jgi:hypothetical protein
MNEDMNKELQNGQPLLPVAFVPAVHLFPPAVRYPCCSRFPCPLRVHIFIPVIGPVSCPLVSPSISTPPIHPMGSSCSGVGVLVG